MAEVKELTQDQITAAKAAKLHDDMELLSVHAVTNMLEENRWTSWHEDRKALMNAITDSIVERIQSETMFRDRFIQALDGTGGSPWHNAQNLQRDIRAGANEVLVSKLTNVVSRALQD